MSVPDAARERDVPTLLVATDGSEPALHAGERAAILPQGLGGKLFVLNAVDPRDLVHAGIHRREIEHKAAARGNEVTGKIAAMADERGVEHEELVVQAVPPPPSSRPPTRSERTTCSWGRRGCRALGDGPFRPAARLTETPVPG